jgi:hypothetical protein
VALFSFLFVDSSGTLGIDFKYRKKNYIRVGSWDCRSRDHFIVPSNDTIVPDIMYLEAGDIVITTSMTTNVPQWNAKGTGTGADMTTSSFNGLHRISRDGGTQYIQV